MSRFLLDTHAFLWFLFDDPRLSQRAADLLGNPDVDKALSIVSVWEIVIKVQIGKLNLGMQVEAFLNVHVRGVELELVEIELPHLVAYSRLPLRHRDPFDRLLVAQAQTLDIPIVTADAAFSRYSVETVWS